MDGEFCAGCLRTMREIVRWGNAGDDEKRQILDAIARRRAARAPVAGERR